MNSTKAIVAGQPGGPDVLEYAEVPLAAPGPGEVRLRHTAIGVNFIDTYYRSGFYAWPEASLVPGSEGAGTIVEIGPDVSGLSAGDRVAYTLPLGAYCAERIIAADRLVRLPDVIPDQLAASVMLKGLTAQYLVTSSFAIEAGHTALVHAAAGGVGLLLGQWISSLGARAIGTVGSAEKAGMALRHGYSAVIDYRTENFAERVADLTGGQGCEVVYDSVGADTWKGSLQCLKTFGTFVSFGQSSGPVAGFALSDLAKRSLRATRPVLFDFIASRGELERRSAALFARLATGSIRADQRMALPLGEAAEAHRLLEGRKTMGAMVLIP